MPKIAVIGTTSWGLTLGLVLAHEGQEVKLWTRTAEEAERLNKDGSDPHLPDDIAVTFPPEFSATNFLDEALSYADAVLLVVPSQSVRQNLQVIKDYITGSMLVVSAAKGLEIGSNKRMSEVITDEIHPAFRDNICVLSGPNLYKEILRGLPASAVVAAWDEVVARQAQKILSSPNFCVYTNTDVIGVELGGALKNVIALGAGMVDGLRLGDNAKAAFVTRGLTEMAALGVAMGASPLTLSGLAGLGDLIATCASPLSRNHYVGEELTKGRPLDEITTSMTGVAEGVTTTVAVWNLAQSLKLEMPITENIYHILYDGADPRPVITGLLGSEGRHELAGRRWRLFSFFRHRRST